MDKQEFQEFSNLFSLNNQETFYWVGFLSAKGKICKHNKIYELKLQLPIKEIKTLQLFKNSLNLPYNITSEIISLKNGNPKYKPYEVCKISIFSRDLMECLKKFGISQHKNKLIPNLNHFTMNHPNLNHFMRGYFDAFGRFGVIKDDNNNQFTFHLRGSKEFLNTYKNILEEKANIKETSNIQKRKNRNSETHYLQYGGNNFLFLIKEFLYNNATLYNHDKFNIIKDITRNNFRDCDDNFFLKDNEESFYWAGFFAADGCVKSESSITLCLGEKDLNHLQKFKSDINSEHSIIKETKQGFSNGKATYSLSISRKALVDGLARFGVVKNKTFIYKMPDWLIQHPLLNHFIRGYFDGDGTVSAKLQDNNKYFVTCAFLGTFQMMEQIESVLKNNLNYPHQKDPAKHKSIFCLGYGGNNFCAQIRNYLYKDATIFLERKKDKFDKVQRESGKRVVFTRYPQISKDELEKTLEIHKTLKQTAKILNVSESKVHALIKKYDIQKWMRVNIHSHFSKESLEKDLKEMGTIKKLGEKYGYTRKGMSYILKKFGVTLVTK